MSGIAVAFSLPWTQAVTISAAVQLPWGFGEAIVSRGGPFTPIDPPDGSTPTGPGSLDATYVLPAQYYYSAVHEFAVTDTRDSSAIELLSFSIDADDGSAVWTLNASAPASLFATLDPADLPVWSVSIDGIEWLFIIEGVQRTRQFPSATLNITGRSITIAAGTPYEFSQNWINEGPASAAQLIDQAQIYTGMEVLWFLEDWLIPDKVWTFAGTPLEVAQRVASSVDATVTSDRALNRIYVRPRYPYLPNEWPVVAPDVEIHIDAAMVDSYERNDQPAYNAIYVSGQQQGALCYVHVAGTTGDKIAPLVTDLLLTEPPACAQRGIAELGKGGPGAVVRMTLPILVGGALPGVLNVGQLCRIVDDTFETWYGIVRAVRVEVAFPSATQSITLERRAGLEGTVIT